MFATYITLFAKACTTTFLGLKAWYAYLPLNSSCQIGNISNKVTGNQSFVIPVLLAIVDDLLIVAGLVAVIMVIVGGVRYGTSQGDPGATAKAQSTIISALVGLAIAIIAASVVSFIGNHVAAGFTAS